MKLQSLVNFEKDQLKVSIQNNIKGGAAGATTEAGTFCSNATATGCQGYTGDWETNGQMVYFGLYESDDSCSADASAVAGVGSGA